MFNYLVFLRHFDFPFESTSKREPARYHGILTSDSQRLVGNIFLGQRLLSLVMADEVSFRVLSEDETKKLDDNSKIVSDFKQNKLEKEAQKNWDLFYKRNTTNFFKDRHWTTAEFKELLFDRNEVSLFS